MDTVYRYSSIVCHVLVSILLGPCYQKTSQTPTTKDLYIPHILFPHRQSPAITNIFLGLALALSGIKVLRSFLLEWKCQAELRGR